MTAASPPGPGVRTSLPSTTSSSTSVEKSRTFAASASARAAQASCPSARSVAANSCFSATVQVGQGDTIQRAPASSSATMLSMALRAATSKAPAWRAGAPQQVWPSGKTTSTPAALRTFTTASPTPG